MLNIIWDEIIINVEIYLERKNQSNIEITTIRVRIFSCCNNVALNVALISKRHRYTHTPTIFIAISFIAPIRLHLTFVEVVRRVCVIEFSTARTNVWVFRDLSVSSGSRHGRFSWSNMNHPRFETTLLHFTRLRPISLSIICLIIRIAAFVLVDFCV